MPFQNCSYRKYRKPPSPGRKKEKIPQARKEKSDRNPRKGKKKQARAFSFSFDLYVAAEGGGSRRGQTGGRGAMVYCEFQRAWVRRETGGCRETGSGGICHPRDAPASTNRS